MNIFFVPSWYPSRSNPIYGIFNQEQAELFAKERPSFKIGVSLWGQGEEKLMLPALRLSSYKKVFISHKEKDVQVAENLSTYFTPAFTWTRRIRKGNIEGIISASRSNLLRHIEKYGKPNIICAQASYPASLVAKRLSQEIDIPYTVTIYMSPFPFDEFLARNGDLKKIIKEPLFGASRLFASCHALASRMHNLGLQNTTVVHLPVDTNYFIPREAKDRNQPVRIFAHGRLEEQKGFDILLEAVSGIKEPFELRIGGDGSRRRDYGKLTSKLGLVNKVKWLGLLDKAETRKEMQSCDFFVLSSRHETFGIVQVEAMACGKPVVATKCGGPQDIINSDCGFLCETENVESLRESVRNMMGEHQNFSSIRIRARAEEKFGQRPWVDQLEKVFKELV